MYARGKDHILLQQGPTRSFPRVHKIQLGTSVLMLLSNQLHTHEGEQLVKRRTSERASLLFHHNHTHLFRVLFTPLITKTIFIFSSFSCSFSVIFFCYVQRGWHKKKNGDFMHLSMHAHTIVPGEHAVASTIRTMRPVPYFFPSPQVSIPD